MSNLTHISFVRHGHVYNPQRVIYGRLPGFGLSTLGQQQAQAAADALRTVQLSVVFSSPLLRAQQTAKILLAHHVDVPLRTSDDLNEVRFFFEGRPMQEMAARDWDLYADVPPAYEQPPDAVARVRHFVARVRQTCAGQHVVAVSHGDVIAFATLWAHDVALVPEHKHTLDALGFCDDYPAPASITTFIYREQDGEKPASVTYRRPYGDALVDHTSPR